MKSRDWVLILTSLVLIILLLAPGCSTTSSTTKSVPHQAEWGIYELNLATQDIRLVYSSPTTIQSPALRLDNGGDSLLFAAGDTEASMEIYSISTDGNNLERLTDNEYFDVYPVWSPDGTRVAFLTRRDKDLDIYLMGADGADNRKLYDSGFNDADIDWVGEAIVFTSQFSIWKMNADGTDPTQVTFLPGRGEWGNANLPKGDYDPRLRPDGKKIVFERMEDTSQPNGSYNFFTVNMDGSGQTQLTDNGYAQGIANWSHTGDRLVYVVAAINGAGKYDIYLMNADGMDNQNITPDYFPADFLCHSPVFSVNDASIFFIGQWWE
ncbi:MAG: PD40 domain-containing protein [Dehalococcoidales bacterium]|nr:PD40 domain-containing protein [Dehalococcoidales bacterium]